MLLYKRYISLVFLVGVDYYKRYITKVDYYHT